MTNDDEDNEQPTMEVILDTAFDSGINKALDEIILAAESMRILIAQQNPAQRNYDTLQKHAHTIDFHTQALPENLEKLRKKPQRNNVSDLKLNSG